MPTLSSPRVPRSPWPAGVVSLLPCPRRVPAGSEWVETGRRRCRREREQGSADVVTGFPIRRSLVRPGPMRYRLVCAGLLPVPPTLARERRGIPDYSRVVTTLSRGVSCLFRRPGEIWDFARSTCAQSPRFHHPGASEASMSYLIPTIG